MRQEEHQPAITKAIAELQELIRQHYPQASFTVSEGDDPEGVYLRVLLDVADTDEVVDVYIDRLLHFQIADALPLYVVPVRPLNKVLAATQAQNTHLTHHQGKSLPLTP